MRTSSETMTANGDSAPMGLQASHLDAATFKAVLGHYASGVAVITTTWNDAPVGFTVSSFTSVSLDPPLVAFCIAETASTWPAISVARGFVVHILGDHQHGISALFARSGADRFGATTRWTPSAGGLPILDDVLAYLECDVETIVSAGDHRIVLGRPTRGQHVVANPAPLVYFRGSYRGLTPLDA
jgi:flavin reductase (DIM6/NTAB) family NADH-FMN oxidoreductase RutF